MNGKLSCRACNRSAVVVTLPFAPYRQSRCDLARHRGYQMLSKMGYEPSQGIGAGGGGRIAPVEVEVKTARTGLGIDEAKKRRRLAVREQQADRGRR